MTLVVFRSSSPFGNRAFTMIEIALALAVIAFGLVAIIGLLPFGLGVQRENRDDAVIDHDARLFLRLVKADGYMLSDTNALYRLWTYISPDRDGKRKVWITNEVVEVDLSRWQTRSTGVRYVEEKEVLNPCILLQGGDSRYASILDVLLLEPYTSVMGVDTNYGRLMITNRYMTVYFRAGAGPAHDKFPQVDPVVTEMSFVYKLVRHSIPVLNTVRDISDVIRNPRLYDVRFTFAWPVYPNKSTGYGRRTYRTSVLTSYD